MRISLLLLLCVCLSPALGEEQAPPLPEDLQKRIETAVTAGRQSLLDRLETPGCPLPLALHALLHAGLPHDHPAVQAWLGKLDAHLEEAVSQSPYEAGLTALLLADLHEKGSKERDFLKPLQRIADTLVSWQKPSGSWGYAERPRGIRLNPQGLPLSDENNSTLQVALLGLQAASHCGAQVPEKAWRQAAAFLLKDQQPPVGPKGEDPGPAGWDYGAAGERTLPYQSMTAAGVASLLLCADHLAKEDPLLLRIRASVKAGLRWMDGNFSLYSERGGLCHQYYYLYTLERLGAFARTGTLGGKPWYRKGAEFLVGHQGKDGGWTSTEDPRATTAFALLFLTRASRGVAPYPVQDFDPGKVPPKP